MKELVEWVIRQWRVYRELKKPARTWEEVDPAVWDHVMDNDAIGYVTVKDTAFFLSQVVDPKEQ